RSVTGLNTRAQTSYRGLWLAGTIAVRFHFQTFPATAAQPVLVGSTHRPRGFAYAAAPSAATQPRSPSRATSGRSWGPAHPGSQKDRRRRGQTALTRVGARYPAPSSTRAAAILRRSAAPFRK